MKLRDRAGKRLSERALRELATVVESSDDAIVSQTLDHVILTWNRGAERLYGYGAEEVVGRPLDVLIPPDRQHVMGELIERIQRGERIIQYEAVDLTKDGRKIDVSLTISPITDGEGRLKGVSWVARDITERKRMERALRESKTLYESLFRSAPLGIGIADCEGNLIDFNDAMLRPGGYTREDMRRIGNLAKLYADPGQRAEALGLAERQGYLFQHEVKFKRKDGTSYDALLNLSPVALEGRRCWQAVVEDISHRKEAEQALKRSEEHYRLLFEGNPLPMFAFDLERLRFLAVNDAMVEQYGYSREELLGMTIRDIRPLDDVGFLLNQLKQWPEAKKPMHQVKAARHMKKDGAIIYVDVTAHEMAFGDRRAALVLAQDVTERRRREELERELAVIAEVARIVASSLDVGEVYHRFAEELKKLVPFDRITLITVDEEERAWVIAHNFGYPTVFEARRPYPLAGSALEASVRSGESIVSQDMGKDRRFWTFEKFAESGFRSTMQVPMRAKGRVFGSISLFHRQPNAFGEREMRLVEALAAQMAPAVEKARLFEQVKRAEEEERKRSEELGTLQEISGLLTGTGSFKDKIAGVLERLVTAVDAGGAALRVLDGEKQAMLLVAQTGKGWPEAPPSSLPRDGTLVGAAIEQGAPLIINDYLNHPRALPQFRVEGHGSAAFLPIRSADRGLGVMVVIAREVSHFTPERVHLLTSVVGGMGALIENAQLLESKKQRGEELQALFDMARVLVEGGSFEEKATKMLKEIDRVVAADLLTIREPSEEGMRLVAALGKKPSQIPSVMPFGEGLTGLAFQRRETVVANRYDRHPRILPLMLALGIRSGVAVPIKLGGEVIGVLSLWSQKPNSYPPARVRLLEAVANQIGGLWQNARLMEAERLRTQELEVLFSIAHIMAEKEEYEKKVAKVLEEVMRAAEADAAALRVAEEGSTRLRLVAAVGARWGEAAEPEVVSAEGGLKGVAFRQGETTVTNDYANEPLAMPEFVAGGLKSAILLPIRSGGRVLGLVSVDSGTKEHFGWARVRILTAIADGLGPLVDNARLVEMERLHALELGLVMDATPVGLVHLDREMRIRWINQTAARWKGATVEELVGRSYYEAAPDAERYREVHERVLKGESIDREAVEVRLGEKGIRFLDARYRPLRDRHGDVTSMLMVFTDVTERVQQGDRLREASRLASIGELAAGVAHELNNPLTAVVGFAQLLETRDVPEAVKDDVAEIVEGAQRAARVVQNLLSFARKRSPQKVSSDLAKVVGATLDLKAHDLQMNQVQVVEEFEEGLPRIMADEHQMQQVFLNIITNAEQVISGVRGKGTLTVRMWREGEVIRLSFADDGPGIPEAIMHKIFDPFFSTKGVGKGTGLGLSICYGIVREHDGRIWAENNEDGGATIHIALPIGTPEGVPETSQAQKGAEEMMAGRVLAVDDEAGIRDLLHEVLTADGCTVVQAASGTEAQEAIEEQDFDCILLDVRMPGLNGRDFYYWMQARKPGLGGKVVFITGDTVSPGTVKFLEDTGNPVLAKPFSIGELQRVVQRTLGTAR